MLQSVLMKRYYIYELCEPNGKAFYIGKTINPQTRKSQHKSDTLESARWSSHSPKVATILKLFQEGKDFTLRVLCWTTDAALADQIEKYLIRNHSESLTNTWWKKQI